MVLQKFELSFGISIRSDNEGSDNGDSDNRGCMVALLVLINPKKFEKSVGFSVNLMYTLFIVM